MRSPSVLGAVLAALLALAAAGPVLAAPAAPGTSTPHSSGEWGPDEAALRHKASALFLKLVDEAHKGVQAGSAKVAYAKNPAFKVDLNRRGIGGSPAAAFQAGIGLNKTGDFSGSDLVYAGNWLFEMVDPNEAAMFLAHEIGHLAYGHPKQMEEKKLAIVDRLYGEWENANQESILKINTDPRYTSDKQRSEATVALFFKASTAKLEGELAVLQRPMEEDADRYGLALALQAGYSGKAAVNAYLRGADSLWSLGADEGDSSHGTLAERARKTSERVAADQAATEKAAAATRRANCAAQGMTCR